MSVDEAACNRTHLGTRYDLGKRVEQPISCAYEFDGKGPSVRRLRIFAIDPGASELDGKTATADVPYETLEPGPRGRLFEVDCRDHHAGEDYACADLDDPSSTLGHGYAPTESDPRFHAQMVYSVASLVHSSFRRALGRQIGWPFARQGDVPARRLRIRPFAARTRNAWYDPDSGTLNFGYFNAQPDPGRNGPGTPPNGYVFTALSHDIVAHEMSHAMLDALRSHFALPTSSDTAGFHEGFADIVALMHHFHYKGAVSKAMADCRGDMRASRYFRSIGQQFGHASGAEAPLRDAMRAPDHYDRNLDAHSMGHLLLGAVFDAFVTVFERKAETLWRLASNGSGILPPGRLPDLLVQELSRKASELAAQFLSMLIRAVDYLPPADVSLGEYLRAIITSDTELVPNDDWRYREALIDAFRRRRIFPTGVTSLNEDSLRWESPDAILDPVAELSFSEIRFSGDPGLPVSAAQRRAQACGLGEYMTQSREHQRAFGLVARDDPRLEGDDVSLPTVESIRTLRRPGPDGRIIFDSVAEIVQVRTVRPRRGRPGFVLHGGATIILDSLGQPRFVVRKCVASEGRVREEAEFLASPQGRRFWDEVGGMYMLRPGLFKALCGPATPADESPQAPGGQH